MAEDREVRNMLWRAVVGDRDMDFLERMSRDVSDGFGITKQGLRDTIYDTIMAAYFRGRTSGFEIIGPAANDNGRS